MKITKINVQQQF